MSKTEKQHRGFAAMSPETQRAIAVKGGKAHSQEHMARIGAKGGRARKKKQ